MRGIGIEQYGDEQQLTEIVLPTEQLGPEDLLISIKASGVNPVDWKVREGRLKKDFPYKLPLILGWDAAGKVIAAGSNVKEFQAGDDVFFRPEMEKQGTYADEIVVPANLVAPMPHGLTYVEAASLPLVGLTVWQALVEAGNVQPGDTLEAERQLTVQFVFTRPDGRNMNRIRELVEAQKLKPVVTEVFPLTVDGARKAHLLSQTGRTRGKIVLSMIDYDEFLNL